MTALAAFSSYRPMTTPALAISRTIPRRSTPAIVQGSIRPLSDAELHLCAGGVWWFGRAAAGAVIGAAVEWGKGGDAGDIAIAAAGGAVAGLVSGVFTLKKW